ncbi:50S ribosomal protein L18 [Chlorobium phaeovibrioides]|uniref:Large ribosomal subunit protein uL18 n=2 Tax=Chlorobium phaeovibrioides TaxID=1094 RepID=RL18_CHLPM|nr:50S ribosomal protein L18 [Chlorobium phaeovibrioides]A4SCS5.1 RecName: Full=Large ribosomal subunit protein uL18; AltName: Full=50S ribosomal protein L18 [Chlorobium phaeovibrioides DSM 265]HCD36586.1 50S ribosomal protein L18 [Chlorobium sp.]KAA6231910.1 50S ribosomal protein L18 [Chlorobium phaeovibrioides]MWV53530.1 50S ribosomal protein L18 [Chlorobium phaeovibrioides]QEQ57538.1 50S ribosomal protein L18 [Chlorobium phaeovibrioides]RTY37817.1 50S ribosomal protein L18 [Chlorobium phae
MSQIDKASRRQKIKDRSRAAVAGTAVKPRLCIYRSLSQIYAQLIDDSGSTTILAVSSMSKENKELKGAGVEVCRTVGRQLGEKAMAKGITTVVFDRNGFRYHGRVKALADGAREAGLIF